MQERVKKDLESSANMAALVLEQVMSAAEESGVSVKVDMSRTEDECEITTLNDVGFFPLDAIISCCSCISTHKGAQLRHRSGRR